MAADRRNGEFPSEAGILLGLGLGGFFDGIVLHQVLQWHHMATSAGFPAHHVNELEPQEQWIYWDKGFLVWGAAMLGGGWALWRSGKRETAEVQVS